MVQEQGGPGASFEDRLQAARRKQGLDTPSTESSNEDAIGGSAWGIGARVGVELVSALVVAVAIGYGLDHVFHTTPILTAVFVPVGGAAGVANLWRLFAPKKADKR